jgi:hypothetical protein
MPDMECTTVEALVGDDQLAGPLCGFSCFGFSYLHAGISCLLIASGSRWIVPNPFDRCHDAPRLRYLSPIDTISRSIGFLDGRSGLIVIDPKERLSYAFRVPASVSQGTPFQTAGSVDPATDLIEFSYHVLKALLLQGQGSGGCR